MKKYPKIRRGTVVEITDWDKPNDPYNKWVVLKRHRGSEYAFLKNIADFPPNKRRYRSANWTMADLKKIGMKRMPQSNINMPLDHEPG